MIHDAIYSFVIADAGFQSVAGLPTGRTDKSTGLFAMVAQKQPSLPYCVYFDVGETPVYSLQGQNRLQAVRIRFSCTASTIKGARQLARQIQRTLNGIPAGFTMQGNVELHGAFFRSIIDSAETEGHMTLYSAHLDMEFWFIDTDQSV